MGSAGDQDTPEASQQLGVKRKCRWIAKKNKDEKRRSHKDNKLNMERSSDLSLHPTSPTSTGVVVGCHCRGRRAERSCA